jgi:hypothetical protein
LFDAHRPRAAGSYSTREAGVGREDIEKIVREYLITNPSILREIVAALQESEEKEKRFADRTRVLEKLPEIYEDPDSPKAGAKKLARSTS